MRPIDEKIIAMRLDNKDFESNARQSLSTMDKIKSAFSGNKGAELNFDGATNGAKGLGNAVSDITDKFSALKVMGVTALATITNKAVESGLAMAKRFTLGPMMDGFNEYQLKMKSIQTIQANTKKDGTKMDEITSTLDELNHYADKTIYNFAEMTRNIGTFTAAGVKLQPAAKSIKGIANLAALSGSSSQQASNAMYQLSQAIASGTVRAQDWISVVNAGMSGTNFQEALKRTARAHGIAVDEMIKEQGSFKDSLSEGWLSADILTETLEQLTMSTEGVTEATIASYKAQLKKQGYTDQQIEDILQLATVAEESATKVRTFEQLFDALGESIGSKWSDFWEMLVGDFGTATDRLTAINDVFGKMMDATFNSFLARMKEFTEMGGVKNLWKGFGNIARNLKEVFKALGDGLKHFLPPVTVEKVYKLSEAFVELTEKARVPKKVLEKMTKVLATLGDIFQNVTGKIARGARSIAHSITDVIKQLSFQRIIDGLRQAKRALENFISGNALVNNAFNRLKTTFSNILSILGPLLEKIFGIKTAFASSGNDVEEFTGKYKTLGDKLKDGTIWESAKAGLKAFVEKLKDFGKNFIKFLKGDMKFKDVLKDLFKGLKLPDLHVFDKVNNLKTDLQNIGAWARDAKQGIQELFNWDDFKVLANLGVIAMEVVALKNIIKTIKALTEKTSLITPNLTKFADGWKTFTGAFKQNMKSQSLMNVSVGLIAFAGALFILSKIDPDRMTACLIGAASGLLMLTGTLKLLEKVDFKPQDAAKFSLSIIAMSVSIAALAFALQKLSQIDAAGASSVMAMITVFMMAMKSTANSIDRNFVMGIAKMSTLALSLSISLLILKHALKGFEELSGGDILKGLGTFTALIAGMVGLAQLSKGTNLKGMAGTILATSAAMLALYVPLKLYGTMKWGELAKGAVVIVSLATAIGLMNRISKGGLAAAGTVLAFAVAINALVVPIKLLGELDIGSLVQGLLGMVGAFAVVAGGIAMLSAAASLLAPLEVSLWSLSKTILAFSGSVALFGVGVLALVGAAKIVSSAGSGIIKALGQVVQAVAIAIRDAVPVIAEALVLMLIDTLKVLDENVEQFVDILVRVLTKVFDKLAEHAEEITRSCVNLVQALARCMEFAFANLSVKDLFLGILAIGAIAQVAKMTLGLKAIMPDALIGIGLAGVLIAEVALVLAAIGALKHIPGVSDAMESGVQVIIDIGRAIGGFFGGIVGGALEGASKGLPDLANNLSDFATNIKPFMEMSGNVPPDLADNMLTISSAMENIAKASIGNAIANFLDKIGGGGSTELFVSELTSLGKGLTQFSKETAGIDIGAVTLCVEAVDKLVEINNSLPQLNGLKQFFTGSQSFETFAEGIIALGKGIKSFSLEVQGIDIQAINVAVQAASKLAELQGSLDKLNGLVQLIVGQGDLGTFGRNIAIFGKGLKGFSDSVIGIDIAAIQNGVEAGKALSQLQGSLDNTGGIVSWFTGDNDLGTFSKSIKSFGTGIKAFSDSVVGIDIGAINTAIDAMKRLNGLSLSNLSSLESNTSGLVVTGRRIKSLGKNVEGFPAESCKAAGDAIKNLSNDIQGLTQIDVGSIDAISNALGKVGDMAVKKIQNSFRQGQAATANVIRSFLNSLANTIQTTGGSQMYRSGAQIVNRLVSGMRSRSGAVRSASSSLGNAARSGVANVNLYGYGVNAGAGFANGLSSQYWRVYNAAANLAYAASAAVRRNLSIHSPSRVMYGLGDFSVAGFVNAVIDGVDSAKNAGKSLAKGAIEGVKNLASAFHNAVDDEFVARPEVRPVLNWDDFKNSMPTTSATVYGQNNGSLLSLQDQELALVTNATPPRADGKVINVHKSYTVNNERMLDGAVFHVREEADIAKLAKGINRLQNEELYRKGILE